MRGRLSRLLLLLSFSFLFLSVLSASARAEQTGARLNVLVAQDLDTLVTLQNPDGSFRDSTKGAVGGAGLIPLAYGALEAAARAQDPAQRERWTGMAALTLRRSLKSNQVLPIWPLVMLHNQGLLSLLDPLLAEQVKARLRGLPLLHAPGVADTCFQRASCFNNYRAIASILDLELLASGLRGSPGSRLFARDRLRGRALGVLNHTMPRVLTRGSRVLLRGSEWRVSGILSDPATYPLAYHVLTTASLIRGWAMRGAGLSPQARLSARRALWGLVGMSAPNGEVSWMGRGADQTWTLGASVYAAAQGARLVGREHPELARRLRRLADLQVLALQGRLDEQGLAHAPTRPLGFGQAGIDHYASSIGNNGLALMFLAMARPSLEDNAIRSPLPSEQPGGRFMDPKGSGTLSLRAGSIWMGVHLRRDRENDGRQDLGLMRALGRRGGEWVSLHVPPSGPGHPPVPRLAPRLDGRAMLVRSSRVTRGSLSLRGGWGERKSVWTFSPARGGQLAWRVNCPRGHQLRWTDALPSGPLSREKNLFIAGENSLQVQARFRVRVRQGRYSSARAPRMRLLDFTVRCQGRPVRVLYNGWAIAGG